MEGWYYLKKESARTLLGFYRMGRSVFGESFWKTCTLSPCKYYRSDTHTEHINKAREVAKRWKTKKLERPEGRLASKLWDAIQEISLARPPRRR